MVQMLSLLHQCPQEQANLIGDSEMLMATMEPFLRLFSWLRGMKSS